MSATLCGISLALFPKAWAACPAATAPSPGKKSRPISPVLAPIPMTFQTTKTTLENGLTLILKEMHHAPVTSFMIWYRVGSRNEIPGRTGVSHWVEHMMFKGTPK
ncbi:MAG: insulinase family protein, partial [Chloroflexi bacterium]|nr:insulinase family protein [Chloroflexota bacterium]